jgi:hypothetical protein
VVRSHRRDEPGRRAAFRIATAVIISGSGLSVALVTAGGPGTPPANSTRTANEVARGNLQPVVPEPTLSVDNAAPTATTDPTTGPATNATITTTQPRAVTRTPAGVGPLATSDPTPTAPAPTATTPEPTTPAPAPTTPTPTTPAPTTPTTTTTSEPTPVPTTPAATTTPEPTASPTA